MEVPKLEISENSIEKTLKNETLELSQDSLQETPSQSTPKRNVSPKRLSLECKGSN